MQTIQMLALLLTATFATAYAKPVDFAPNSCGKISLFLGDTVRDLTKHCGCKPGFRPTSSWNGCEEVNECHLGLDNCHPNATCTDTFGSFGCTCKSGLFGNGVECDLDECASPSLNNCHAEATCANTPGSFTCTCKAGFSGNGLSCTRVLSPVKLTASDGAASDEFGYSVSVSSYGSSGDAVAVVGAYLDQDRGFESGSAYVFRVAGNGTAVQTAKLTASDGAAGDYFGSSVSISSFSDSGDAVVVVGAYYDDARGVNSGSAYVFRVAADGTATQTAKMVAGDGVASDYFGNSVSVSSFGSNGDAVAVVGAYHDDARDSNSGSAYVFRVAADGTTLEKAKLTASDGADWDQFGNSVSVSSFGSSGNAVAVVGAFGDDDRGSKSGSAYVFRVAADGTATQTVKLTASDGAADDHFANSVSVSSFGSSGDAVAAVGAYLDDDQGGKSGSTYLFRVNADGTATQTAKLTASDGAADDQFGGSVSVSSFGSSGHAVAVVGAWKDDDRGSQSGSTYVFRVAADGTATQTVKLTASDGASDDQFGLPVSVSSLGHNGHAVAVVGAFYDDDRGDKSGSAVVFFDKFEETNECLLGNDNCHPNATCTNTYGSFGCTCKPGFVGDGVECDLDECAIPSLNNCHADATCGNTPGSFTCTCKAGFSGNGLSCARSTPSPAKLTASDGAASDEFGYSVSVSSYGSSGSAVAVVGSPHDDDRGGGSGSAYVFRVAAGDTAKLTASDGAENDNFGISVSVSSYGSNGDAVAVVGAWGDDDRGDRSGSAYIFRVASDHTVTQTAKLTASDGTTDDFFGASLSASSFGSGGDVVVLVGAYGDDSRGDSSGSAYVFRVAADGQATQSAKLMASDGAANDHFGIAVSVSSFGNSGDAVAVVGAWQDNDAGSRSGSAYVFRVASDGTATQTAKLTAIDGAASDFFGIAVSVSSFGSSGDAVAVIGARADDDRGSASGSAYVFHIASNGVATQTVKLTAGDGGENDVFGGNSVSVSSFGSNGDAVAVVGATGDDDRGSVSGSAYVFRVAADGSAMQTTKLTASDGASDDAFGVSACVSSFGSSGDAIAVVGAYKDDDAGINSGSAYVFVE